jgi:ribosomal protein S27AE
VSTFVAVEARCPRCGHTFSAEAATGLHVSRMPEIRARILAGTFHRFDCPACDQSVVLHDRTFVYTDFDRWHWITCYPRGGLRYRSALHAQAEEAFDQVLRREGPAFVREEWAPRFVRRVVYGLAALREKLLVLEAGLDDRALERFKWMLVRDVPLSPFHPDVDLLFERVDGDGLVFVHVGLPGPEGLRVGRELRVARAGFDALEAGVGPEDWRSLMLPDLPLPEAGAGVDPPMPTPVGR